MRLASSTIAPSALSDFRAVLRGGASRHLRRGAAFRAAMIPPNWAPIKMQAKRGSPPLAGQHTLSKNLLGSPPQAGQPNNNWEGQPASGWAAHPFDFKLSQNRWFEGTFEDSFG